MSDYSFTKDEMLEPVQRLFEREYANNYGLFEDLRDRDIEALEASDAAFIGGDRESLHLIQVSEDYDSCLFNIRGGIHALDDLESNSRWLALPLDKLRKGEDAHNEILKEECNDRGLGLITLQPKGRGVSAKVIIEPVTERGDFLELYPQLDKAWKTFAKESLVGEEYKVVNYYDR